MLWAALGPIKAVALLRPLDSLPMIDAHPSRFLRLPEVLHRVGLSRSTLYRMIKAGAFPDQVKVTARTSAWPESAVSGWMAERLQRTGSAAASQPSG